MTEFAVFWQQLTRLLTITWLIGMGGMMLFIVLHVLWQNIRPPRGR